MKPFEASREFLLALNEIRHISVHRIPITVEKLVRLLGLARTAMSLFGDDKSTKLVTLLQTQSKACNSKFSDRLDDLSATKQRVEERLQEIEKEKVSLQAELKTATGRMERIEETHMAELQSIFSTLDS